MFPGNHGVLKESGWVCSKICEKRLVFEQMVPDYEKAVCKKRAWEKVTGFIKNEIQTACNSDGSIDIDIVLYQQFLDVVLKYAEEHVSSWKAVIK